MAKIVQTLTRASDEYEPATAQSLVRDWCQLSKH